MAAQAKLQFNVGQCTQDWVPQRSDILFNAARACEVQSPDENGQPTMAMFIIRDPQGQFIHPRKRLALILLFTRRFIELMGKRFVA
jgi:hypothetical protein